jgi:WD40 repeat protein
LTGHRGYIHALVFWPDGKKLASSSSDQTICLWDLNDLTRVPPPRTLRGHKREIYRLTLMRDNVTLVSGCQDGSVCFWDTATNLRQSAHLAMPTTFTSMRHAWRFGHDGKSVLTVDHQHRVLRWQGADFAQMQPLLELGANLRGTKISDDEELIAAGYGDGMVQIWDLPRQKMLREFTTSTGPAEPWQFLGNGKRLLLKHPQNSTFTEWDLKTWRQIRSFDGVDPNDYAAGLSFDERWLFSVNPNHTAKLGDARTSPVTWRTLAVEEPGDMAVTADSKLIAVASRTGFARLFDTATLREVVTFRNFLQGVHGAAFSPDDKRLVTGSDGREAIKLWDVEGRQELLTLEAKGGQLRHITLSPDGVYLGADDDRSVVHLWRAPSWAEIEPTEK